MPDPSSQFSPRSTRALPQKAGSAAMSDTVRQRFRMQRVRPSQSASVRHTAVNAAQEPLTHSPPAHCTLLVHGAPAWRAAPIVPPGRAPAKVPSPSSQFSSVQLVSTKGCDVMKGEELAPGTGPAIVPEIFPLTVPPGLELAPGTGPAVVPAAEEHAAPTQLPITIRLEDDPFSGPSDEFVPPPHAARQAL